MERNSIIAALGLATIIILTYFSIPFKPHIIKSQTTTPTIYEVKPSSKEALSWTTIDTVSKTLGPGEAYTYYLNWMRPYQSNGKLLVDVYLNPAQYYSCYWYNCSECLLYSYTYCSEYQCTIQAGTPYSVCQYTDISEWKCVKNTTKQVTNTYTVTGEAYDGPDLDILFPDADYLSIPIGMYPYDNLGTPTQLIDYFFTVTIYTGGACLYNEFSQYGPNAWTYKVYYSDGTSATIPSADVAVFPAKDQYGNIVGIIYTFPSNVFQDKQIDHIEIWDNAADVGKCYTPSETFTSYLKFVGDVPYQDVQYVNYQGYQNLTAQGYTCTPYLSNTISFTISATSCNVVKYTNDLSLNKKWVNGYYYVYCDPTHLCTPEPPNTIQTGTTTTTKTITSTNKTYLYSQGCTDSDISCIATSTKTGTLNQYLNDVNTNDASNPSCVSWSSQQFRSTTDKTKTTGEPPFYKCTMYSTISPNTITNAICNGPTTDTVKTPAKLTVQNITRAYYSSTTNEEIDFNIPANSFIPITMQGATFTNLPNQGNTVFNLKIEALLQNPYIISEQTNEVTPPNASYKVVNYTALIYSPGDLYAKFYPDVCLNFENEGLKYRIATINGEPVSGDPCSDGGALLYLTKGTNTFLMTGYSINPSEFPSCTEHPNTCEEQDLYGCPAQCKVQSLSLECPALIRIKTGFGETANIPIKITAGSEGYVKIYVQGKGLVMYPKVYKINLGSNDIDLKPTYYIYANQSQVYYWKVIVENPASYVSNYKPEIKYCEVKVEVIPSYLYQTLSNPQLLVAIVVILAGILLMLLAHKPK